MNKIEHYNLEHAKKQSKILKDKISLINDNGLVDRFIHALRQFQLLPLKHTSDSRSFYLKLDDVTLWGVQDSAPRHYKSVDQIEADLPTLTMAMETGWTLPNNADLSQFIAQFEQAWDANQVPVLREQLSSAVIPSQQGLIDRGNIVDFAESYGSYNTEILLTRPFVESQIAAMEAVHQLKQHISDENFDSSIKFIEDLKSLNDALKAANFELDFEYSNPVVTKLGGGNESITEQLNELSQLFTQLWPTEIPDHLKYGTPFSRAYSLLTRNWLLWYQDSKTIDNYLEWQKVYVTDNFDEKYQFLSTNLAKLKLRDFNSNFASYIPASTMEYLHTLEALDFQVKQCCANNQQLLGLATGLFPLTEDHSVETCAKVSELQETQREYYARYTQIIPLENHKVINQLPELIKQTQTQLSSLYVPSTTLADLTHCEQIQRPSIPLLAHVLAEQIEFQVNVAERVIERGDTVEALQKALNQLNSAVYNSFENMRQFEALCHEEKIGAVPCQRWQTCWQQALITSLEKVNVLLAFSLPTVEGWYFAPIVIEQVTAHIKALEEHFLHEVIYSYQKYFGTKNAEVFEQLSYDKLQFQLHTQLLQQCFERVSAKMQEIFSRPIPDDLTQWLQDWANQNLASLQQLTAHSGVLSSNLIGQLGSMRINALNEMVKDAEQLEQMLKQRDKHFVSLMFKMEQELEALANH
uniref:hypothetical protein n=1 Tax=Thaumasiovibrio occultus TaxID=1891184 RepID=UPI000B354D58|nr:hypothetical protein [Thaumasiovibrio occultus]